MRALVRRARFSNVTSKRRRLKSRSKHARTLGVSFIKMIDVEHERAEMRKKDFRMNETTGHSQKGAELFVRRGRGRAVTLIAVSPSDCDFEFAGTSEWIGGQWASAMGGASASASASLGVLAAAAAAVVLVAAGSLGGPSEVNTCDISEFRCPSKDGQGSICLPMDRWCNGKDDCDNRADEPRSCSSKSLI